MSYEIEVPGHGSVEFPDDVPLAVANQHIKEKFYSGTSLSDENMKADEQKLAEATQAQQPEQTQPSTAGQAEPAQVPFFKRKPTEGSQEAPTAGATGSWYSPDSTPENLASFVKEAKPDQLYSGIGREKDPLLAGRLDPESLERYKNKRVDYLIDKGLDFAKEQGKLMAGPASVFLESKIAKDALEELPPAPRKFLANALEEASLGYADYAEGKQEGYAAGAGKIVGSLPYFIAGGGALTKAGLVATTLPRFIAREAALGAAYGAAKNPEHGETRAENIASNALFFPLLGVAGHYAGKTIGAFAAEDSFRGKVGNLIKKAFWDRDAIIGEEKLKSAWEEISSMMIKENDEVASAAARNVGDSSRDSLEIFYEDLGYSIPKGQRAATSALERATEPEVTPRVYISRKTDVEKYVDKMFEERAVDSLNKSTRGLVEPFRAGTPSGAKTEAEMFPTVPHGLWKDRVVNITDHSVYSKLDSYMKDAEESLNMNGYNSSVEMAMKGADAASELSFMPATTVDSVMDELVAPEAKNAIKQTIDMLHATENIPAGFIGKVKDLANTARYLFSDMGNRLVKAAGKGGGRLHQAMADGHSIFSAMIEKDSIASNEAKKILKKYGPKNVNEAMGRVVQALENRAGAEGILQSSAEKTAYSLIRGRLDEYKTVLEGMGIPVLDNYFTHMRMSPTFAADLSKNMQSAALGIAKPYNVTPEYVTERIAKEGAEYSRDLFDVFDKYSRKMSRFVGFKNAIDYVQSGNFIKDVHPRYLTGKESLNNRTLVSSYLDAIYNPTWWTGAVGRTGAWMNKLQSNVYKSCLWNNIGGSAVNKTQTTLADARLTGMQKDLLRVFRSSKGKLSDESAELMKILRSHYTNILVETESAITGASSKFGKWLEKADTFKYSEKTNWDYAALAGVTQRLSRDPRFITEFAQSKNIVSAANRSLKDPKVFEEAYRYGANMMRETQIESSLASKPMAFRNTLSRWALMFMRFPAGAIENMYNNVKASGADGGRALSIMRRGIDSEVQLVDRLWALETLQKSAKYLSRNSADKVEGAYHKQLSQLLEAKVLEGNRALAKIEGRPGGARGAAKMGAYMMEVAAVTAAWRFASAPIYRKDAISFEQAAWEGVLNALPYGEMSVGRRGYEPVALPVGKSQRRGGWIANKLPLFYAPVGISNRLIPGRPVTKTIAATLDAFGASK